MPRPTVLIRLKCNYCGKYFDRIKWYFTQNQRRGIKKYYCTAECKNKYQSQKYGNAHKWWKGGRQKCKGYIKVWTGKNKRVLEHRLVMEKHIGRELLRGEVVHHINGIRNDNRIENLVLCQTHGTHTRDFHPEAMKKGAEKIKQIAKQKRGIREGAKSCFGK